MTNVMTDTMTEEALFELLTLEYRVDSGGNITYHNSDGELHRIHGPAVVCTDDYCAWFQNGQRHRLDGPAVEHADGRCAWWQNGQLHRLDGPAIERADDRFWFINGVLLSEAEWQQQVASMETV